MTPTQIYIKISKDFTRTPGARKMDEGNYSGEEFLKSVLEPAYLQASKEDSIVQINLDDTEGYATSFLEEAFGGLARKYGSNNVLDHLDFVSNDEPLLIEEIRHYIKP